MWVVPYSNDRKNGFTFNNTITWPCWLFLITISTLWERNYYYDQLHQIWSDFSPVFLVRNEKILIYVLNSLSFNIFFWECISNLHWICTYRDCFIKKNDYLLLPVQVLRWPHILIISTFLIRATTPGPQGISARSHTIIFHCYMQRY